MNPTLHAQILTLRKYQAWRTGEDERTMDEAGIVPRAITSALNAVLDYASEQLKAQGQPIAKVTGWYGGHLVVEPTNRAVTLPVGMALYAAPQTTKES